MTEVAERPFAGELARAAKRVRSLVIDTVHHAGVGHPGADMSSADILTVLYLDVLDVDPDDPAAPDRDRFILSKSHASAALYSAMALRGFLAQDELRTYAQPESRLCTSVSKRLPGVELSTGALGHGLPFAVGAAFAARLDRSSRRVIVMTGDGELQEGSNWEAAMLASTAGLDNLMLIVDRNRVQKGSSTEDTSALEPLADKFRAFGWNVVDVDGHDTDALLEALQKPPGGDGRPTCVLAETVKGKGVSFMENDLAWHSQRLTDAHRQRALDDIWGDDERD